MALMCFPTIQTTAAIVVIDARLENIATRGSAIRLQAQQQLLVMVIRFILIMILTTAVVAATNVKRTAHAKAGPAGQRVEVIV
jgi:hypothetical protein